MLTFPNNVVAMYAPVDPEENLNSTATQMAMVPCPGNWTVIQQFIDSYNPQYFNNRPWIIMGLFSLAAIGFVSNCYVILYLVIKSRVAKSAFTLLVLQLALADGMVCLFCLLSDAIWNVTTEWFGGTDLCRFIKFMQMFSLYASTMILTGMTVERCITVTYPFTRSRPQAALQRAKAISISVWCLATLCSIPQAVIFHVERAPICADFLQCVTFGTYTEPWQEVAYTMSTLCVMFLIPLIIIIACFVTIFAKISREAQLALGKQEKTLIKQVSVDTDALNPSTDLGSGRMMYRRNRLFSLWTTLVIAVVFVLCWAPYYITMMAYLFNIELSNGWMTVILSFGMTSTVLNPMIYGVFKVIKESNTAQLPDNSRKSLISRTLSLKRADSNKRQHSHHRYSSSTLVVPSFNSSSQHPEHSYIHSEGESQY